MCLANVIVGSIIPTTVPNKNDVNITRTASKMIMSEGYIEQPLMITPGYKSIDEIITQESVPAPHQYADPMPPEDSWTNKGSLNTSTPSLADYNANEAELWGNGSTN